MESSARQFDENHTVTARDGFEIPMNAAGFFAATGRRSLPCNAVSVGQKGLLISSVFWPDIGERIRLILDFKAIEPLDGPLFATKEVALKKTTSHIQCEVVDQEKQGFSFG